MKQLLVMILAFFTLCGYAQETDEPAKKRSERSHHLKDMTPEQIATLKTKRMTLDLDLDEKQRDEIYKMHLEEAQSKKAKADEFRNSGKKRSEITNDERYQGMNDRLDKQIEHKQKMRSVLNEDQFQKWDQGRKRGVQKRNMRKRQKGMRKRN